MVDHLMNYDIEVNYNTLESTISRKLLCIKLWIIFFCFTVWITYCHL